VFTGSIRDLLTSQNLEEVFKSFKEHELEFETFLRPIMQEVLRESNTKDSTGESIKTWDHDPWVLLSKSICEDNKVHTDMIRSDKRNRYVSKLIKLRQQQNMLRRESERQRIIEEEKVAVQKLLDEERSRILSQ